MNEPELQQRRLGLRYWSEQADHHWHLFFYIYHMTNVTVNDFIIKELTVESLTVRGLWSVSSLPLAGSRAEHKWEEVRADLLNVKLLCQTTLGRSDGVKAADVRVPDILSSAKSKLCVGISKRFTSNAFEYSVFTVYTKFLTNIYEYLVILKC